MPFHLPNGSPSDVPMMHPRIETGFAAGDGWQAVHCNCGPTQNISLTVDRPFLYLIRDSVSGDSCSSAGYWSRSSSADGRVSCGPCHQPFS